MSEQRTNLERMIQLAEDFFGTRSDPDQISVTPEVREQLLAIHPATMSEKNDGTGPVAWVIVIPTTRSVMDLFLRGEISESELLDKTPVGAQYTVIYLCSALVLPEERRKGLAVALTSNAIASIGRDHSIIHLFAWTFSREGELLARQVAARCNLPIQFRRHTTE
jgi:hypothetical protein